MSSVELGHTRFSKDSLMTTNSIHYSNNYTNQQTQEINNNTHPSYLMSSLSTTTPTASLTTSMSTMETTTAATPPPPNPFPSRDPIQLLGDYMLRGWVLMGDTCQSCPTIPLVFNKHDKVYFCVQCEQHYLPESHSSSVKNETKTSHSIKNIQKDESIIKETTITSSPTLPSNDSYIMNRFYKELQSTVISLCDSSSISEKLSIIDLLEREWRVYQSFLSTRKIMP